MSFRIEEKLFIDKNQIVDFKEFLNKSSAEPLFHPRQIKSLYFDNKNLEMFTDSIEGLTPRKKIRIRRYPNEKDSSLYFEIKNSSVEGRFKTRKIIDEKRQEELIEKGYLDNQYGEVLPKLFVTYNREYFKIKDTRVSIDTNLTYQSIISGKSFKDFNTIIEVKTSFTKDIDELTQMFPFQKIRFSKYCLAAEKVLI